MALDHGESQSEYCGGTCLLDFECFKRKPYTICFSKMLQYVF